jgi:hypothetical protein
MRIYKKSVSFVRSNPKFGAKLAIIWEMSIFNGDCGPSLSLTLNVEPVNGYPAHIVGWVKRDVGTIYVGFAYLNASQKFELATKLANPTRLVADRRLNPTYDLSFRPTKWIPPFQN